MHDGQNDQRLDLHDDALLRCLRGKLAQERQITAEVLRLMAEVDRRRLYAQSACDSMFAFATRVLGMSEAAAYKRIQVARAGRRFPTLFARIGTGRPHLSGLCVLVPHLTADNHQELLDAAAGLGKRQIERLVAQRFPQPPQPLSADRYLLKVSVSGQLCDKLRQSQDLLRGQVADGDVATVLEQALDALIAQQLKKKYAVGAKARRTKPQPQQSRSAEASPTASPAASTRAAASRSRAIPAAIRRAVYQRDGGQCCFVDPKTGQRCQARAHLQFHHDVPFARGGPHSVDNVMLFCAAHNAYMARRDYGAAHIQAAIDAKAVAHGASPTRPGAGRATAPTTTASGHPHPAVDAPDNPSQPHASP